MQVLWAMTIFEHNWLTPNPHHRKTLHIWSLALALILSGQAVTPECLQNTFFCFYSYFFCLLFFYSPAASALTVKSGTLKGERHISKNAWMLLVLVELKHELLVWNILSRLNTKNRQQTLIKHIQKERKEKHLCRFSPLFLLQRNIQSELLCAQKNMCGIFFFQHSISSRQCYVMQQCTRTRLDSDTFQFTVSEHAPSHLSGCEQCEVGLAQEMAPRPPAGR